MLKGNIIVPIIDSVFGRKIRLFAVINTLAKRTSVQLWLNYDRTTVWYFNCQLENLVWRSSLGVYSRRVLKGEEYCAAGKKARREMRERGGRGGKRKDNRARRAQLSGGRKCARSVRKTRERKAWKVKRKMRGEESSSRDDSFTTAYVIPRINRDSRMGVCSSSPFSSQAKHRGVIHRLGLFVLRGKKETNLARNLWNFILEQNISAVARFLILFHS